MKKVVSFFAVTLALFVFFLIFTKPVFVQAAVDSERAAQVFAGLSFDRCSGGFDFERWEAGSFLEPVYGNFTFIPSQRAITFLTIYNEVIIDETSAPLKGLPINEKGEARGYSAWLSCYDSSNEYQAYGNFFKEVLWPEDTIIIVFQASGQQVLIPYTVPAGVAEKNLKMALFNSNSPNGEWEADYCSPSRQTYCQQNGFTLWLNPLLPTTYEVKDVSTGVVYATGIIDLLATLPVAENQEIPINIQFPGGIMEVKFEDTEYAWEYFTNQKLDGEVKTELCPEEVPIAPVYGKIALSSAERTLMMGAGRSLFKFRATAPVDADAQVGSREFSVLAWSNSGSLELRSVALYAYMDSNYSTPYVLLDPSGMVAPSSAASVTWFTPNNETGGYIIFGASSEKEGILRIPAGQTMWFELRADISGYVPAINGCALIGLNTEGLGEEVLVTAGGMCEAPTLPTSPSSGGSGSAHGPAVPSSSSSSTSINECSIETVPAKVYFMDLNGGALNVNIGELDGTVEVRRWVPTGEMPLIATGSTNYWGYINTATKSGYGKVVVIVTGVLRDPDGFYISFGRQPQTSGGGMGGKG